MTYSAIENRAMALQLKITRAKILAKVKLSSGHSDEQIKRPSESRDAKKGDYLLLIKRIKDQYAKNEDIWKSREARRHHD